ncbi:MAG: substrate-binding domain-containing protein [Candidatus Sabulitectum sp.]|nr:substrate-binding domain-containing protein [Candidatus Sabulitectum sp.]
MKRSLAVSLFLLAFVFAGCGEESEPPQTAEAAAAVEKVSESAATPPMARVERLRVATTTSLYDTGLWGYLEPMFEDRFDVELDVLYAGTGKAIDWGKRGDVDVITVHSRAREELFVSEGYGVERVPFAYNYFLIVGPADDPAGISGMNPEEAFAVLMDNGEAIFVSRGDDSGTHGKEKSIWTAAGFDYDSDVRTAGAWYVEGGSGMGPTLVMANEMQGYTLSDIGTYLAYQGDLDLVPIVDQGDALLNVYSVLQVEASGNPELSLALVEFLTSPDIQQLIGNYGLEVYGIQLFTPCAGQEI